MNRMNSILFLADLNRPCPAALQRAAQLAASHKSELSLLTVIDAEPRKPLPAWVRPAQALEQRLAEACQQLRRLSSQVQATCDVQVRAVVRTGDVLSQVRAAADDADLVVVGVTRDNLLREFLFGTPAERLVRISRRPVLVVKQPPVGAYRRVLVAVDFGAHASASVRLAARLGPAAEVHLFHALEAAMVAKMRRAGVAEEFVSSNIEQTRARCARELHRLGAALPRAKVSVDAGWAPSLMLKKQQDIGADLVIVGKEDSSRWGEFLLGSTSQQLLASVTSDVLVIPKASLAASVPSRAGRESPAT